jgi:hypothetical protein
MDRREFVIAGSFAAAVSSLQWLRGGGMLARDGAALDGAVGSLTVALANGTAVDTAKTVFEALVRAVLPSDDPRFAAIAPAAVADRADRLFAVGQDTAVQQNLVLFDDLVQFVSPPPAVGLAEPVLFPPNDAERSASAAVAARTARDAVAYQAASAAWRGQPALFTDLTLAGQRTYLMLWARSALGVRRRFYRSMKTLVMAATYSMDDVWPIIRYAGPLLHLPPR